jgi:hypothetical protein
VSTQRGYRVRLTLCTMLLLPACAADGPARTSPELVLVDSVIVADTGAVPIAPPTALVVTEGGTIYMADRAAGTVLVVDRSGRVTQRIGRRGRGPGEWSQGPGSMLLDGDSVLVVNDGSRAVRLRLPTGEVGAARTSPGGLATVRAARDGRVWYNAVREDQRAVLAMASSWEDSLRPSGPFPAHLVGRPALQMMFSTLAVLPWRGDSVVVAIEGVDSLYVWPSASGAGRTVPLPAAGRRGAKVDLLLGLNADDPASFGAVVHQPSQPWAVARVGASDTVAVLHYDLAQVEHRMTAQLYVSLVDVASGRACVDAQVPVPMDPLPAAWLQGRTLAVVTQEDDAAGAVRTVLRRFEVRGEGCGWR